MKHVKHQVHGVDTSLAVRIDYDRCVGCQMCAITCNEYQKVGAIRPAELRTPPYPHSTSGKNHENTLTTRVRLSDTNCIGCGYCITACSTGAIYPANRTSEIQTALHAGMTLVAVVAPATRIGVAEGMKMPIGMSAYNQLVAGLRKLGFYYVFDTLWGTDATAIYDAKELLKLKSEGKGPVFTSCCSAWINLVEQKYPEVIPYVSACRSPNAVTCAAIKRFWSKDIGKSPENLYVVGIMPCTAKKFEIQRRQLMTNGVYDCDLVITTREILEMFKEYRIQFTESEENALAGKPEAQFDAPFNVYSGSAFLFGRTGGVTESVIRYLYKYYNMDVSNIQIEEQLVWESRDGLQTIKMKQFECGGYKYRLMMCNGGSAVDELMRVYVQGKLSNVDCIEMMMCPYGCIGGGGYPKLLKKALTTQRKYGLDISDKASTLKACSENTSLIEQIQKWAPTAADQISAFYTHYDNRRMK